MNDHENDHPANDTGNPATEPTNTANSNVEATEKRIAAFDRLVDWFIEYDPYEIQDYVSDVRSRYPLYGRPIG